MGKGQKARNQLLNVQRSVHFEIKQQKRVGKESHCRAKRRKKERERTRQEMGPKMKEPEQGKGSKKKIMNTFRQLHERYVSG